MKAVTSRYSPDNGPEVFGLPGLEVRWNRHSQTLILVSGGGRWSVSGPFACDLAHVHRQGQLRQFLCQTLEPLFNPWQDRYYRCGRRLIKA